MKLKTFALTLALSIAACVPALAQLPGPPVGVPQTQQSVNHGYNFAFTWTPQAADGSGIFFQPTINTTVVTSQTVDGVRITPTIVFPNSTASGTTVAGLHVGTTVATLNSATLTNAANVLIDAAPATGTNKYSLWAVGNSRIDGQLQTQNGGNAPSSFSCGSTGTGSQTCTPAANGALTKIYNGTSTLSGSTATITFAQGGFTSATSYNCVANDVTTRANPVQMVPSAATTAVITNTTGGSDVIQWICVGQ